MVNLTEGRILNFDPRKGVDLRFTLYEKVGKETDQTERPWTNG